MIITEVRYLGRLITWLVLVYVRPPLQPFTPLANRAIVPLPDELRNMAIRSSDNTPLADRALIPLPDELRNIVIRSSDNATLAAWVCVSRLCWRVACPILWEDLHSAVPLLALLDQRERKVKVSRRSRLIPSEEVSTCSVTPVDSKDDTSKGARGLP